MALPEAQPTAVRPAVRGEGPVWDHGAGELLWADTVEQEIRWGSVESGAGVRDSAVRHVGEPVSAVCPTISTGWLLAAGKGFRSLFPDGRISVLLDLDTENGTRMGAGAADRAGRFFAGAAGPRDRDVAGALYRIDLDGLVSVAATGLTVVTGIGWSPGDDVVYLVEPDAGTVTAFDYDVDLGTLGARRVVLDVTGEADALLHGLAVDRAGHLWVALWGAGEVRRYSAMGTLEDVVPLRATRTTGCAFAGPALGVLVITTSAEGLSAADQAAQPDAGRLFTTRVPDVVGRPAFPYRGPLRRLTRAD